MADDLLTETIQLRYPRLLASGVDYNDAQAVLERIKRIEDWCALGASSQPAERTTS